MTNAEAVNWLINITADIGKAEHSDLWHYEQALSEIREMLEDAHTETHDNRTETHACDLIDRQAAIDAIDIGRELLRRVLDDTDVVGVERAKYEWGLGLIESYIADIKELPSAQQERTRGRWIPVTNGRGGYECDQCHNYAPSYQDGVEWLSDFCPNCGVWMIEEPYKGEQDG